MSAHARTSGPVAYTSSSATDVGKHRTGNEDRPFEGVTVFAVADGMGGHVAGEVASQTALEPLAGIDDGRWPTAAQAERALADAVRSANHEVVEKAASDRALRGMGTTLTAVLVREGRLHVAHVGDSRAYLLRPDEGMSQLTTDHTLVEQLVQEGRLSRDEIATHPQRSVITRAIGVETTVEVDTLAPLELRPGDQVLLCSDGLTGPVGDDEIRRLLTASPDPDEACAQLVAAANAAGGPDNITVVLLRVVDPEEGADASAAHDDAADAPTERHDDTAELVPLAEPRGIRRIRTRQADETGFDARSLGRLGTRQGAEPVTGSEEPPLTSGRRALAGLLGALVLLLVVVGGGWFVLSRSFFVGVDDGRVAIFSGLPNEMLGVSLHRVVEASDLQAADLAAGRRGALERGIPESSLTAAQDRIDLLRAQAEPDEPDPGTAATPGPSAGPTSDATAPPAPDPAPPASTPGAATPEGPAPPAPSPAPPPP